MGPGNGGRSVPQDRGGTPILGRTNSRGQPRPSPGPGLHMNPGASEPGVKSGRLVAKILGSYFRKTPPSRPANMPPCQLHAPVNRRKRRFRSRIRGLQGEPRGFVLEPSDARLKLETPGAPTTCEMFGICRQSGPARINLNGGPGSTYRTVAPRHGFEPRT